MSRTNELFASIARYRPCEEDGSMEYIFDSKAAAQNFVDYWIDRLELDEAIYLNEDGSFSVRVYGRG